MKNIISILVMFVVTASITFAGVKLEFSNYEVGNEDEAETNYTIFTPDKMKIENNSNNGLVTILYNSTKDKMIIVNHQEKNYMVFTREMIKNLKRQISSQMDQFKQQFANLPEAQRKQMEKMMESQLGGMSISYTVDKTGETKKVNSWNTTKYNLKANEELKSEIWAAPFSTIGISESDFSIMEKFSNFSAELLEGVPGAQKDSFSAIYDEIQGIPVMTKSNTTDMINELVSVDQYDATDSDFEIPFDYSEKKMTMPGSNR